MNTDAIRQAYLDFFKEKDHTVIPSSSLVPLDDPTLLFTSAGMVQIKPYFLGEKVPPNPRLTSCQKCFRTTDIESVGDTKHLTFFEMLGNFSVGNYFKSEAIAWAWEFIIDRLKIPADRIWITVFADDDEAFNIWRDKIGVPTNRILRFGAKDNFWGPAGSSGPCGPCSELHYDFGDSCGCGKADCSPGCGCGRFVEIWNLVFTQFNQDESGARTALPRPNIDTGMGLERLSTVLQGKTTVYDTDIFRPILANVARVAGKAYGENTDDDNSMRVVAEHSRAIAFLVADGVMPANDGRGYVLRRLIRRAALFGKRLGLDRLFLAEMCDQVIGHMKNVYPELEQRREMVLKVAETEESRFHESLNTGLNLLDNLLKDQATQVRQKISGADVFKLYDTYGFPVELTREIVARAGLAIDMDGFEKEMENQRERARSAHKFDVAEGVDKLEIRPGVNKTEFAGYHQFKYKSKIRDILIRRHTADVATQGQEASLILEATPFYGEMGGQVGDTGIIEHSSGKFVVSNTVHAGEVILHIGKVETGSFRVNDEVEARVEAARRRNISSNHTATHLLQFALRHVLGQHVQQRGSMVGPVEFRFDFSHLSAMTAQEILRVQQIINEKIRENLIVDAEQMGYKEAVGRGATALFDEKYGDMVRVIKIGTPLISAELCGGTHVSATGQIGFFQIIGESSIGSGLRRIEAVTGKSAEVFVENNRVNLEKIAHLLGTSSASAYEKVTALLTDLEDERKKRLALEKELSHQSADDLMQKMEIINGVKLISAQVPSIRADALREMSDLIKQKLESGIVVLGTVFEETKPAFVAVVTPDLVQKGYNAGTIVKKVAQLTGGGGGGKAGLAQAGGKDKTKIDEALQLVKTLI